MCAAGGSGSKVLKKCSPPSPAILSGCERKARLKKNCRPFANCETEANVLFILRKVRGQMSDNLLVLLEANGLTFEDQVRTISNR